MERRKVGGGGGRKRMEMEGDREGACKVGRVGIERGEGGERKREEKRWDRETRALRESRKWRKRSCVQRGRWLNGER